MITEYMEVLFEKMTELEILEFVKNIYFIEQNVVDSYYYDADNYGNKKLIKSQILELIDSHFNMYSTLKHIKIFGEDMNNVQLIIQYFNGMFDLTLNFEQQEFCKKQNKIVEFAQLYSYKHKNIVINIGFDPVDEDTKCMCINKGVIEYIRKFDF